MRRRSIISWSSILDKDRAFWAYFVMGFPKKTSKIIAVSSIHRYLCTVAGCAQLLADNFDRATVAVVV